MSLDTINAQNPRASACNPSSDDRAEAALLASKHFSKNRASLERAWPRTVRALPDTLPELDWCFARDGALSAKLTEDRWFNDISVPQRAAERMLEQLSIIGTTAVLLAPTHASQVRRALSLLTDSQALIVVIPGELNAGVIVACDDFSAEIASGRLWLAVGPDWQEELKAILDTNDGLTPPQTMIRVPGLNANVVELVSRPCDVLLSTHVKTQRQLVAMLHAKPRAVRRPVPRACVLTSGFRLWDAGAQLLAEAAQASAIDCVIVDTSSPTQASDLRFARASDGCDVVLTANVGRADRAGIVPDDVPWLTWATTVVPSYVATAKADRLIVADDVLRERALAAGWPATSVTIACEPWQERLGHERGAHATIILDLPAVSIPKPIEEMSSLRLVWELIERELTAKALRERGTIDAFILGCADRVGVPRESFPLALFRDALVLPLFARELALELATHRVDFTIHGEGWEALPSLQSRWRGPVRSTDAFVRSLGESSAILDVWPGIATHPAQRTGLPIVAAWGQSLSGLMSRLRAAKPPVTGAPAFELDALLKT